MPLEAYLSTSTLTKNASLIVDLPIDYAVNIDSSELFSYSEEILNDRLIRKWIIKNYQLPSSEEFAPPVYELLPKVKVLSPKNFFMELRVSPQLGLQSREVP